MASKAVRVEHRRRASCLAVDGPGDWDWVLCRDLGQHVETPASQKEHFEEEPQLQVDSGKLQLPYCQLSIKRQERKLRKMETNH